MTPSKQEIKDLQDKAETAGLRLFQVVVRMFCLREARKTLQCVELAPISNANERVIREAAKCEAFICK